MTSVEVHGPGDRKPTTESLLLMQVHSMQMISCLNLLSVTSKLATFSGRRGRNPYNYIPQKQHSSKPFKHAEQIYEAFSKALICCSQPQASASSQQKNQTCKQKRQEALPSQEAH